MLSRIHANILQKHENPAGFL